MRRLGLFLAFLLPLPAGAVVGGTEDDGDPAVVSLTLGNESICTGALIAPSVVLTAGHCLSPFVGATQVVFGPSILAPTLQVGVDAWAHHPQFSGEGQPYDFALLHLREEVTSVTPLPLAPGEVGASTVGLPIRHVGFGIADELTGAGSGTKRTVTYPITNVAGMLLYSGAPGEQTCRGDSGAPALFNPDTQEVLLAVVSDGPDCHSDGWDDQVGYAAEFIQSTRAMWDRPSGCSAGTGAISPLAWAVAALWAKRRRPPRRGSPPPPGRRPRRSDVLP